MESHASELARRLAERAEDVCRHYLSNGRRNGRYWSVGDVMNAPGRSLYVRLTGPTWGPGARGKWADAATGEHGDLLDLIVAATGMPSPKDAMDEAAAFLGDTGADRSVLPPQAPVAAGSNEAAQRLWAAAQPIHGTVAERYLVSRGITGLRTDALRFHPRCYHRDAAGTNSARPALIAKVFDQGGTLTGVHRTWLDPASRGKAPIHPSRKAMGRLTGNGVWFGRATDLLGVGEGIETTLSVRMALPTLPCVAALSSNHLAALIVPPIVRRLYVITDADEAGEHARRRLTQRVEPAGMHTIPLTFPGGDANDALRTYGVDELRAHLRPQLAPDDVARLLP